MIRPSKRVTIFAVIGLLNTAVDFTIYATLYTSTANIIVSNIAATSVALVLSFILNRKYTFNSKTQTKTQFVQFVGVTLFGVWVLQTLIIHFTMPGIREAAANLSFMVPVTVVILLPKLIATAISLVWNYLWYSRVIFKDTAS